MKVRKSKFDSTHTCIFLTEADEKYDKLKPSFVKHGLAFKTDKFIFFDETELRNQGYFNKTYITFIEAHEIAHSVLKHTQTGRLAEAEAQFRKAQADVVAYELELKNTTIRAPFDGIFNTKAIDVGDILNLGGDIGTVVDLNPIKITGQVSEQNISGYKVGMPGKIKLTDGSSYGGILSYVASVSDDKTRTFKVELTVENPNLTILGGLAAELELPKNEILAHQISPSVLSLAEDGRIGIKTVDNDTSVRFWPVRILDDGPNGTWISGLPNNVKIIVVGQDLVEVGQSVNPVTVSSLQ